MLFWSLPDANAFNAEVTRIFIENDNLTSGAEIKLLEILAQSGTAFSETLNSYRMVIFVLLVFAAAMLIAALVFLIMLVGFNRRMAQIERVGIQVNSLLISREENTVYLNNLGFKLTDAAMEYLVSAGFDPVYGARPLKRAMQQAVENPLAQQLLSGDFPTGAHIRADLSGDQLVFRRE